MKEIYQAQTIEQQVQTYWDKNQSFKCSEDLSKEKFYCLSMFPYPSGKLHMGHVRNYTLGDIIARYQRMQGKNVLQPMGWDAFGLPAENAAIQNNIPPAQWTYANIEHMRGQLKRLGFAYDWKREIATCQPDYYRWEQWFFTRLYEKGLAYKKNAVVNWDPVDQTVLANEQVIDGRGWRSGALVERREIPQWFLKITAYAEELLDDIDQLEHWPEQVRTMQRNWIGRSIGTEVQFDVVGHEILTAYTTRIDTLMGATFITIAPQHPLAELVAKQNLSVKNFIETCRNTPVAEAAIATLEKQGIATGLNALHPITKQPLPIWIANFVVMEYGSGTVMSVPAHDQRDFEFAKKYQLPIQPVIAAVSGSDYNIDLAAYTEEGTLINSGEFNGLTSAQAKQLITQKLVELNKGRSQTYYRLRDWSISRQRYWGTPIPIINCPTCGTVVVPEDQLPVVLPENVTVTGSGSPLKAMPEFYQTTCPHCEGPASRETDTFDTFMESSWYYARFACKNQDQAMLDDRAKYWTPVDHYIGGIEHAVLHLLYARFYHKLLRDEGLLNSDEPFTRLLTQGMVLKDGAKMSKSKGNVIDPHEMIEKYGADTIRLFITFAAPPEQSLEWSDSGVEGSYRFLKRLWSFAYQQREVITSLNASHSASQSFKEWDKFSPQLREQRRLIHETLRQARYDFERLQFNTVVSACMKLLNILSDTLASKDSHSAYLLQEGLSILLRLLTPITPHITHVLWQELNYSGDILQAKWPKVAVDAIKLEQVDVIVQINGKLRDKITVAADASAESVLQVALKAPNIVRYIENKTLKKHIYIPSKLINLVIAEI